MLMDAKEKLIKYNLIIENIFNEIIILCEEESQKENVKQIKNTRAKALHAYLMWKNNENTYPQILGDYKAVVNYILPIKTQLNLIAEARGNNVKLKELINHLHIIYLLLEYDLQQDLIVRPNRGTCTLNLLSDFIVVDIETSGLNTYYSEIIELSAIRVVNNNQVVDTFSTLIKPNDPVSQKIVNITNITNEMLEESGVDPIDALNEFLDYAGDSTLLTHNGDHFDINFIYDQCMRKLNKPLTNNFMDMLYFARFINPDKGNNLAALSEKFNVDYSNAHRALDDCYITREIFGYIKDIIIKEYGSLANYQRLIKHYYDMLNSTDLL